MQMLTNLMLVIALATTLLLPGLPQSGTLSGASAYVDASLYEQGGDDMLSVIVTGVDSQQAAQAVAQVGGRVTSHLWLIDGVAATIPARALPQLAARPGIRSIVNNQSLEQAGEDARERPSHASYQGKRSIALLKGAW